MCYDYSNLCLRIFEVCKTQAVFAQRIGLSERSVSLKLNNKVPFTQKDIANSLIILGIREQDIGLYFFVKNVQRA